MCVLKLNFYKKFHFRCNTCLTCSNVQSVSKHPSLRPSSNVLQLQGREGVISPACSGLLPVERAQKSSKARHLNQNSRCVWRQIHHDHCSGEGWNTHITTLDQSVKTPTPCCFFWKQLHTLVVVKQPAQHQCTPLSHFPCPRQLKLQKSFRLMVWGNQNDVSAAFHAFLPTRDSS